MALTDPADIAALSALLDQALELPAAERETWLAALPPEQQRHAQALRAMLAQHDSTRGAGFLASGPQLASDEAVARAGEAVGPWRLLREIGRGGMGSVWLAERADGAFERQVALKLPRLAWDAGLGQRMAREREIGARLEHPAIARLYDAGLDERGRPYLALEYIDGQPIDVWCEAQALDVRARLRLFLQVARAVAYAHGRLVVHRDLKPSNVLVSADGQAHLLDFGIAKLLHQANDGGLTQEQGRVLTPHYASPEQLAGEAITVQSDVYSLGVLLYELLTGTLPHLGRRNSAGAVEEAILQGDAPLASSRARDKARARALRGELDAILGKAMQREPRRRYATSDAFAQDIERHLADETVSARPDSVAYRLRKALRRHSVGFAAAAAVVVAVISGGAVAALQADRAARAAERERIVKAFVAEVLRVNGRAGTPGGALLTAPGEALLEECARLVQGRFTGQPDLQAELYGMVGQAFAHMGASRLAAEVATRRIHALEAAGAEPHQRAPAALQLAEAMLGQRRYEDAEQRALQAAELAGGDAALAVGARVIAARALAARERWPQLEALLATLEQELHRPDLDRDAAVAWVTGLRAQRMIADNRREQAMPLFNAAIEQALRLQGPNSLAAVELRLLAAHAEATTTHVAEATAYFDAAHAVLSQLGPEHQVRAAYEYAIFSGQRRTPWAQISFEDARVAFSRARHELALSGRVIPTEMHAAIDYQEARVTLADGRDGAALPILERVFPVLYPLTTEPSARHGLVATYGRALMRSGRHEEADPWLREALKITQDAGQGQHPSAAADFFRVSGNLSMWGRHAEALAVLDSVPHFEASSGEGTKGTDRYNRFVQESRVWAFLDAGDYRSALEAMPKSAPVDQHDLPVHWVMVGAVECAGGNAKAGLQGMRRGFQFGGPEGYEHGPQTAWFRAIQGRCALRAGQRAEALDFARKARRAFVAQPDVSPYYKAPLIELERQLGLRLPPV